MWKIEVMQRRNYKILIFMREDNAEGYEITRGSIEVYDDEEYKKWLKALEVLNKS